MIAVPTEPRTARRLLLAVLTGILLFTTAVALPRPRIGLALGGGGARGVAHIGVLKALEEMRIPVDCIAGTSMGALVGGVYAAGVPADRIASRVARIDWNEIFSDDPPRTEQPWHAKRDDFDNLFDMELGRRGTRLLFPKGSTSGYKFEFLLREMVAAAGNRADQSFDELPIPFRALATNIENGSSKQFDRGDLVKTMRASMSVPGAVAPVDIDGALYVDGGLLQNLPVASVRSTCADVVIAVNVGSGLLPRSELNSALGVSLQMINVMMEQNVRESRASLRPDDILIEPRLGDFSSTDFAGAMPLIELGMQATHAVADRLQSLALSAADYAAWRSAVLARQPHLPPVSDVRVATTGERVNPAVIERELAEVPGIDLRRHPETDFSLTNLNTRLEQVYGRGDFERMDYRMLDGPDTRIVEVQGVEKSWGPDYLKFGLGVASDSQQTRLNGRLSHRSTWINALGAEWHNDLQLGFRDRLSSEFYQPVSLTAGAFLAPRIELQDEPVIYYQSGSRLGDYRVRHSRLYLDLGVQNKYGEARMGLFGGRLSARGDFGLTAGIPDYDVTQVGYSASLVYDQIDSPAFARDGVLARLDSFGTRHDWGSDDQYNKTSVLLLGAKSIDRHALQLAAWYGDTLQGDLQPYDPYQLGGFLRGSGYAMDELVGNRAALLRGVYSYRIAALPAPLGRGVYAGGSLEATRASTGTALDAGSDIRPSASVFIGADTFLGPAFLAWGQSLHDDRSTTLYFLLGKP